MAKTMIFLRKIYLNFLMKQCTIFLGSEGNMESLKKVIESRIEGIEKELDFTADPTTREILHKMLDNYVFKLISLNKGN